MSDNPLQRLRDLALADLQPMTPPNERTDLMMWAASEIERLRKALFDCELLARRQGAMKTASGIQKIAAGVGVHYGK